jgi:hypothetical protein
MVFGCIRKSKHKGIQELSACSTASWCHCTGESASFKKLPFLRLLDKMFQRMMPNAAFARDAADLDEQEQATLTAMCQANETARTMYHLVQECAPAAAYAIRRSAG